MKILYLNHNYKGEATYKRCFFIGRELVKKGHSLTIITVSDKFPDYCVRRRKEEGVDIITLPAYSRDRDFIFYALRPFINIPISFFKGYDILHSFTVAEPVVSFPTIFNRLKNIPIIIDWDDIYSRGGYASKKPARFIIEPLMMGLEENVLKMGNRVTVVSETLKAMALELGINRDKIYKISNGADSNFIRPLEKIECRGTVNLPKDRKIILNMERNNALIPEILDIFQKVFKKDPRVILICLGNINKNCFNSAYKKKISQFIGEKKLILTGSRHYKDVPLFLGAADVLILYMEDNVIDRARSPLRLGDYLSSGRPIVGSDIGEVGYILRKYNCGLVAKRDIEFVENINTLLEDDSISSQYGNKARQVAERELDWYKVAEKMLEVYKGL